MRIEGPPPVIDGRLDEAVWQQAQAATDFIQTRPTPGAFASLRTEARVLFDDDAVYVGMRMYDPQPKTIVAPLLRRGHEANWDWVWVEFDSRHDYRSGFSFGLNPRGVQADGMWLNDTTYDETWDAVWEGEAVIQEDGWTAEFRIPFSQLRHIAKPGLWIRKSLKRFGCPPGIRTPIC